MEGVGNRRLNKAALAQPWFVAEKILFFITQVLIIAIPINGGKIWLNVIAIKHDKVLLNHF